MIRQFFVNFDLFSASPTLRARGQTETMNLCGGIVSMLLLVFFIYVFIITFVNTLNYSKIDVIEIEKKFQNGEGQISDIYFAIGLQHANYQKELYPYARFVAYKLTHTRTDRGLLTSGQQIQLQPCKQNHFTMISEQKIAELFNQYRLQDKLCPIKGKNLTIINTYENNYCEYLYVAMVRCENQTDCLPDAQESIKKGEPLFLSLFRYFQAKLYIVDTGFNPASKDPTFSKIQSIRGTFTTSNAHEVNILLSQYEVDTDEGIMPWEERKIEKGYFVRKQMQTDYESQSAFPYVMFTISFSDKQKVIERTVGKIDEVLSYAGGLSSIIISFLGFFLLSYNEYRYEIMVGEGAFNYNDDGEKLKEEDFTFLKYMKYSFYDWIQLLSCCELNWKDCEEIAGTRQEANNQLDVSLLFKKIQHLERAVEYMMSEKEEICLYLTEPPSLSEVKRKRKLSEYYDKIVQGNAAMTVEDVRIKDNIEMVLNMGANKSIHLVENQARTNTRFKDQVDKSRENILEFALQHYLKTKHKAEEDFELDEEDQHLEEEIAEAFFHMKPEKRAKIQEKIPLKILHRLEKKLNEINSKTNAEITF